MAAAGGGGLGTGGKIRSRRYHLSSGRAPYTKTRQQNQQGIISRVKDTVKSIVPVWLQKYFNNVDEVNEVPRHTNEPEEQVETQNDVENDHFADKESLPQFGRAAQEPVKIQSDPATNPLMNISDVLTRPSLHRANLNIVLDSPALNCQPSTSGFSLVKEVKDSASLHDDDNISTTSGFSSRASDKDVAITKTGNAPSLWSPEVDRTPNVSQNSSFNSKKPTFNPSAFASFLPNSSQLGDSPFYPGKTTYGGAAAACQSRVRSTPYRVPVKKQVVAKPAHVTYGVTSLAARRILQSLEKMSSPLADAKRIPSVSSVSPLVAERSFSEESSSKRKKVDSLVPPVRKLVTPQSVSVSSSLRKIRPSLASMLNNSSSCRTQSSDKHKEKGNHEPDTTPQQTSFSYPTFSTPASNGFASARGGGKMMRERGSAKPSEEEVEVPCLPEVPLPISMTALPKFSLNMEKKTSPLPVRQPVSTKCTTSAQASGFNFSQPVVKAISSSEETSSSPVGFTFRAPALKTSSPYENTKSTLSNPVTNSTKKVEEEHTSFCKPAQSLKEGSVLDILRSPGFQSTSSQHTRTSPAKSAVSSPKPLMFGQSSKQALGIWYCDCCLVENKASDNKCVACGTVKDQATEVTKQSTTLATTTPSKNTSPLKCVQGFGDMFKVAPGTWDCDTCLVQNKPEASKCVACGSPKPGTGAKDPLLVLPSTKPDMPVAPPDNRLTLSPSLKFEELARKPIGSWECTVCCVQNRAEDTSCVACTSPKPGASTALPAASFPPSLPASQGASPGFGKSSFSSESTFPPVKFGLPPSSDAGEQKSSSSTDSSSLNTNKVSFSFTFGQSSKTLDEKKDKDLTFGTTTGSSKTVSTPFKFGFTSPASAEKDSSVKPLTTDFQFGTKPESASNANLLGLSGKEKSDSAPTFGLKKTEEKKTDAPVVGGFTFGKVDQKETATPFAFGKNEEKTESTATTTTTSLFGSKSDAEQPKTFVFGKPEASKADAPKLSSFAFGAPNPTEKREADQSTKPVFAFGSSATETGSSKPAFGFQSSGSSSAPQSSNIGNSSSVFGSVPQTNSSSVFGSPAVQPNTAAPAGGAPAPSSTVFSSSSSLPQPTGTSNVFGAALNSNTPAGSSSIFGSNPASGTSTSSSIVFGSAASVNTSSSSSVFGNAAPTNTSASSSSGFGSTAPTNISASSNTLFGNANPSANPSSVSFVFGQPTTTASGSLFGSGNESKSSFVFAGQESKPAETSASTAPAAATPFLFGATAPAPAATGFNFGGTNTSNSTGTSSTPFIFGASSTAPVASGLAATSSVPNFGKTVPQTNTPAFGSPASASLFPSGSQTVPSFGSLSSNVQPPAFGQQSTQPTFGSSTAPPAGGSFAFGSSNFNFGGANSSGVFTFGSNSGANPAQPANTGFAFNQAPSFNMGSNGKTVTPSSISNRKIKTARRRK